MTTPTRDEAVLSVDALAQEIRRVDGSHSLGAGALAEALMPFLLASAPAPASGGVDAVAAIAKIINPEGFKLLAEGNNLATGQAANYRDAYGKAHLILATLSPAATPVSEAGGEVTNESVADATFLSAFLRIDAQRREVPESVRKHLLDAAALLAALAKPASSPAGGGES